MIDRQQRDTHVTYRKGGAAAALVATLALVALPAAPASAIARGAAVPDGKYPFAVKIIANDIPTADGGTRDSSCSGGLVSPHWVLTAGHCFRDVKNKHVSRTVAAENIAVVDRTDYLNGDGGHEVEIVAVKQAKGADVALAKLDEAITDVTPMKLVRKTPRIGTKVRLTGYGFVNARTEKLPARLQTGVFRVSSISDIELGVTGVSPYKNTSACEHDSGGPYFTEAGDGTVTVVGVVSHGPTCPHTSPDAASRIDNLLPWIQSVIGKDVLPKPSPSIVPSASASAATNARAAVPGNATQAGFTVPKAAWLAVPVAGVALVGGALAARRSARRRADRFRHSR